VQLVDEATDHVMYILHADDRDLTAQMSSDDNIRPMTIIKTFVRAKSVNYNNGETTIVGYLCFFKK